MLQWYDSMLLRKNRVRSYPRRTASRMTAVAGLFVALVRIAATYIHSPLSPPFAWEGRGFNYRSEKYKSNV